MSTLNIIPIDGQETLEEKWSELQKHLQPLSLILFRGTGIIGDVIIDLEMDEDSKKKALKFGNWSHSGLLINSDVMDIKNGKPNTWYVYEMTMSGKLAGDRTPNIETGKSKFGTQIRELSSVVQSYPGKICIVHLKNNPTVQRTNETDIEYSNRMIALKKKATAFKRKQSRTWYQLNILQLLASVFPDLRWIRYFCPISRYWAMCSDIVASFYKALDILGPDVVAADVLPQDFISDKDHQIQSGLFELPGTQILSG